MRFILRFSVVILFTFTCLSLKAQYFNEGQDRASIQWKYIRTLNFEVIFPEGFEKQANHVAKLLEKAYRYVPVSLNHKPKKISVVLHTGTVKSNAFLGWAPSRIEMYATPDQDIYSQDWLEQLSIHEFRHMVQISKLESEMPQLLRYLFGEQAAALLTAAYLPFWFIEGDAVSAETGLSNSGRGRVADFQREIRAQLVEKGKYSYDKAYLGSFRDHVANYYNLGYLLVGGARDKYHKLVWDSVLTTVAQTPFSLTAFDKGLKKSIGLNKIQLYNTLFDDLTLEWKKEDQMTIPTKNVLISPQNKSYTNYKFCQKLSSGKYFAEKTSLSDINRFVTIDTDGKEKKLFTPGYHFTESVSALGNYVIWSERLPHPRWEHADRSLIRILNINNGKLLEHKYKSKIFAPVLSPGFDKILTVETDNKYQFYLSVFDLNSGKLLTRFHSPSNDYFITPSWGAKPDEVVSVILRNDQKGIARINLASSDIKMLLNLDTQEIRKPKEHNGFIYFISDYTRVDNLYALDLQSGKVYEVIVSRFGIADYSFDNNSIIYDDYTSNGYCLVKTDNNPSIYREVDLKSISKKFPIAENLTLQEKGPVDFSKLDNVNYQSEKYIKTAHLLHIHSWAPVSIDPYNYAVYPGFSVMSQNMLSTTETTLGYRYKMAEKKGEIYARYRYFGWFPVLDFQIDYGKSKSSYYQINKYLNNDNVVIRTDTVLKQYSWKETNFSVRSYLPFDLNKGKFYNGVYPRVNYHYTYYQKDSNAPSKFPEGAVHTMEAGLYCYSILHSSQQAVIRYLVRLILVTYSQRPILLICRALCPTTASSYIMGSRKRSPVISLFPTESIFPEG